MDDIFRDISRLNLIYEIPIAQESLSPITHIKDFVKYYFTRFVTNLSHVFNDFSISEIEEFNKRHLDKISLLVKHPSFNLEGVVVPIPKGMVNSYNKTLTSLMSLLETTHPTVIKQDFQLLLTAMDSRHLDNLKTSLYSKDTFNKTKFSIGNLFGKTGLTHSVAKVVLVSKSEIKSVNDSLLTITKQYYSDIIALNEMIKTLENHYTSTSWTDAEKVILSKEFITMAYRLSILAVIMDHIQSIEHMFIESLKILFPKIN